MNMYFSMASYYEKYYLRGANETDNLPLKILNAWDYNINDVEGCSIKQQSIAKDIEVGLRTDFFNEFGMKKKTSPERQYSPMRSNAIFHII